ncbi:MAG TPA: adenylate/guanylate cyclase domain-containing protein, partial [Chloroflexota bacterium]|nr:adenylate/guanylate cyclase domain-containing protein [Chloroflexota bacterium]
GWAAAAAAGCLIEWRTRGEWAQSRLLDAERATSDRLLLNVLPAPIAGRLKSGETEIADRYEECTVLFADIVGFTGLTRSVSAREMVGMLNRIFSEFDALADRYGLEKIKTIGDGYHAVAGVPTSRPDHTEAAAAMALAMQAAVRAIAEASGWPLRVRIGLDTGGPVLAGIIGTRKFAFDLWGDVVNTAARMESHGVPDEIQVTQAVRDRLEGRYAFGERGEVEVKGLGRMRTHFLTGTGQHDPALRGDAAAVGSNGEQTRRQGLGDQRGAASGSGVGSGGGDYLPHVGGA